MGSASAGGGREERSSVTVERFKLFKERKMSLGDLAVLQLDLVHLYSETILR